jgi:hypothetical protein
MHPQTKKTNIEYTDIIDIFDINGNGKMVEISTNLPLPGPGNGKHYQNQVLVMASWWKFPPTFHYHHIYAFVPYCITYVSYFLTYVPYNYSYMYNYITEFFNIKICLILKRGRFIQPIPSRGVGYVRDHCVLCGERQLVCDAIGLS